MIFDNLSEENKALLCKRLTERFYYLSKGLPAIFEELNEQEEFLHQQNLLFEKSKEVNFVWTSLQPWGADRDLEKALNDLLVKPASNSAISKAELIIKRNKEYIERDLKDMKEIEKILNSLGVFIKRKENGCLDDHP